MSSRLDTFVRWERALGARRTAFTVVATYMCWDGYAWAKSFASSQAGVDAMSIAAIIAAVTVPIGWFTKAVLESYFGSKRSSE